MPAEQGADHERPEPQVDLGQPEGGRVRGQDDVAAEDQADPAGQAQALHARDHRDGTRPHREHDLAQQAPALVDLQPGRVRRHLHEVGPRAEDLLARTRHQHDAGVPGVAQRGEHAAEHLTVEGVPLGLAVEVEPQHQALAGHGKVAHCCPPSASGRCTTGPSMTSSSQASQARE